MTISKGKCQALHVGWNNLVQRFRLANCLESSFLERDLGVLVGPKMNVWQQCHCDEDQPCWTVLARV